jgi:hypothetical protein
MVNQAEDSSLPTWKSVITVETMAVSSLQNKILGKD